MTPTRDTPLLADALTADRSLRAFARALCADEHRAEDLAQHAWLRALEHGVRDGLAAFLRKVVRNRAIDEARVARRRAARERAAARDEGTPSAAELSAREQTRRALADAVARLDEPYRTTVWLRFFEDLPPREVARRTGVPVETVRTRLRRALDRLRAELDERHGERAAWVALLLPLGRRAAGVTSCSAVTTWLVMHKTSASIAAVALAAVCLVPLVLPTGDGRFRPAGPDAPAAARVAAVPPGDGAAAATPELARSALSAVPPPAAPAATRRVELRHADGQLAVGTRYWLWRDGRPRQAWVPRDFRAFGSESPELGEPDGTTGADGALDAGDTSGVTFRIDERLLVSYAFATEPEAADVRLVLPALARLSLRLPDASADDRWRLRAYPGGHVESNPSEAEWAATFTYEVATGSGPAVVFAQSSRAYVDGAGPFVLLAPVGHGFGFELEGLGFGIEPQQVFAVAPGDVLLRRTEARPVVEVVVHEADGTPTALAGRAFALGRAWSPYVSDRLDGGAALLVAGFEPGPAYRLRVVLADGEEFETELVFADGEGLRRIDLVRGTGLPRKGLQLPQDLPGSRLEAVLAIGADGGASTAEPWQEQYYMRMDGPHTYAVDGDRLSVSRLPEDWTRILLFADDGRAWSLRPRRPEPEPLPDEPLRPIRLEELRRAQPGTGYGFFAFDLLYADERGRSVPVSIRRVRFDPATGALPSWELRVPQGFGTLLQRRVGPDWRELPVERLR